MTISLIHVTRIFRLNYFSPPSALSVAVMASLRSVLNPAVRVVLLRCNSDHVTPLRTVLQRKSQSLQSGLRALQSGSHYFCDLISYCFLTNILSASATLVSLPFREHTKRASFSRHLPFTLLHQECLSPNHFLTSFRGPLKCHHSVRYFYLRWLLLPLVSPYPTVLGTYQAFNESPLSGWMDK